MPTDHCVACDGTDLYLLEMFPLVPVVLRKSRFAMQSIPLNVPVCLTCRLVTPYVGQWDVKELQRWKKADDKRKPQKTKTAKPTI